jgi:hypothetical protein
MAKNKAVVSDAQRPTPPTAPVPSSARVAGPTPSDDQTQPSQFAHGLTQAAHDQFMGMLYWNPRLLAGQR